MTETPTKPRYTQRRRVDVMISSTSRDLPDHRKAAIDAVWRRSLYPIAMETLTASPADAIDESLTLVDQAEVYVGIIGYRYGYVPDDAARNPNAISITEMEYRRAVERDIPILIFLMGDEHPGPTLAKDHATFYETDPASQAKLAALKAELEKTHVVGYFNSPEELSALIFQALTELIEKGMIEPVEAVEFGPEETALTAPPAPHIPHPYVLTQKFFGRAEELRMLDAWATDDEHTTMIIEAIGGVGKSALTWEWVNHHAPAYNFDGVLWWSFYESDSAVSNFTRHALAYLTGQTLKAVGTIPRDERERQLLEKLCAGRYLLVLDGLERILVAYHRIDAPQVLDHEVETDLRGCTDDRHALLLQKLTECAPTKILISTRLKPSALENKAGGLLPKVDHHPLNGLHPDDAVALMVHHGVTTTDEAALRAFMEQFGRHSLLLTVIAGRIGEYRPAPGDFDAWFEGEGQHLRLSDIEIKQRRTGILKVAFDGLKPELRKLLQQVAAFRYPVDYATISALNPYAPPKPQEVDDPFEELERYRRYVGDDGDFANFFKERVKELEADLPEKQATYTAFQHDLAAYEDALKAMQPAFHAGLDELEERGLLQWDRVANKYDLHPIVRAYGFDEMDDEECKATFLQIRDHFESMPPSEEEQSPTEIAHLRRLLEIYFALIGAELLDDAADYYMDRLQDTLLYHMATYPLIVELLKPLFPNGTDQLPDLSSVSSQCNIVTALGNALYAMGQNEPALILRGLQLKLRLDQLDASNLSVGLLNYSDSLRDDSYLAAAQLASELARDLAEAVGAERELAFAYHKLLGIYRDTGQWALGEAAYAAFLANLPRSSQISYWQAFAEQYFAGMLIYQGLDATGALDRAGEFARKGKNVSCQRQLHRLRGEVALQRGDAVRAAGHFLDAIALARRHGSTEANFWLGRLAVARALQDQFAEARQLIVSALDQNIRKGGSNPLHQDAAEVYLALGEKDTAKKHVMLAYKISWADGPPHSWWWRLERAKTVLAKLGIDPPDMPPFDPVKVEPIPYEDEIRAFIEELRLK